MVVRDIKTEIHFVMEKGMNTSVLIKRGQEVIGRVWSQAKDSNSLPHATNETIRINSIQICGFDRISEIWGCGPFDGKKDCVASFNPENDAWYLEQAENYAKYIKRFFENGAKEKISLINRSTGTTKDVRKIKSFHDWLQTGMIG